MTHSTKPKAAVFDRWFFRLGGGERYVCELLIALRVLGYDVSLFTCVWGDLQTASEILDVDLSDVSVQLLPDIQDYALGEYTKDLDLFVNCSFLDYVPSKAKNSSIVVFFPTAIHFNLLSRIKLSLVSILRDLLIYPNKYIGLENNKLLGKKTQFTFNRQNVGTVRLVMHFASFSASIVDGVSFGQGEEIIKPVYSSFHPRTQLATYLFKPKATMRDEGISIHLNQVAHEAKIRLLDCSSQTTQQFLYLLFASLTGRFEQRLHGGESGGAARALSTYTSVIAISQYTQDWILRMWGKNSYIISPPVDTTSFSSKSKKNWIVSTGRFFVGAHNKKQLELVQAFKQVYDKVGKATNLELHLIGQVADERIHQKYLKQVEDEARGYPVIIHKNASVAKLREVLSTSKIYWHATGLNEDKDHDPIRFEHFGISVVEAMASGCIPLVYNGGALPELVNYDASLLFDSLDDLIEKTIALLDDRKSKQLEQKLRQRSSIYDRKSFRSNVKNYVEALNKI